MPLSESWVCMLLMVHDQCCCCSSRIAAAKLSCHFVTSVHLWGSRVETNRIFEYKPPPPLQAQSSVQDGTCIIYNSCFDYACTIYVVIEVNNWPTSGF